MQYVNGTPAQGTSAGQQTILNPATGEVVETYPEASARDVDAAVAAAKTAFPQWASAAPADRAAAMLRLANVLRERADEFAAAETRQTGKPIRLSTDFDVPGTIDNTEFFAGTARNFEGKSAGAYLPTHTSMIRREPLGVIGSIAPWNYPLQMAAWKILRPSPRETPSWSTRPRSPHSPLSYSGRPAPTQAFPMVSSTSSRGPVRRLARR